MKSATTMVLLIFVAVTTVYVVVGERYDSPTAPSVAATSGSKASSEDIPKEGLRAATDQAAGDPATDGSAAGNLASVAQQHEPQQTDAAASKVHKVFAYYFHSTQRCHTCLTMQAYAEQVLKDGFSAALESGEFEWRAVNVDEPRHEHYVKDYELIASALVMVDTEGGQVKRSKKLEQIWDLVGDEVKFKTFIRDEAQAYLEATP